MSTADGVGVRTRRSIRPGGAKKSSPSLRIGTQLERTLRVLGQPAERHRLLELLGRVGFPDPARVAASYPHELSGGMCQRVCLALALAGGPDLLVADEPTTALDVAVQARVLRLIVTTARASGMAVILVTHDMALVRAVADRVIVLYGGGAGGGGGRAARAIERPWACETLMTRRSSTKPVDRATYWRSIGPLVIATSSAEAPTTHAVIRSAIPSASEAPPPMYQYLFGSLVR